MAKIQFWRGTQAQYDVLKEKNGDTLYFITDVAGKIYLDGEVVAANDASSIDRERQDREAADAQIRTDFAAADTTLQGNINKVTNKIGDIADATVAAAITRLDQKDVELNTKIDGLTLSGGGMVYTGVLTGKYNSELTKAIQEKKLNKGATFTINFTGDFYGHTVEVGDMVIFVVDSPNTIGDVKNESFVTVQANLSASIQSSVDDLTDNSLVLGSGGKNVKTSYITETALTSAMLKADNAVLKTGDHTMAGKLTATGFVGNLTGAADRLRVKQGISLSGGVIADSVGFDGSEPINIKVKSVDASKLIGNFSEGSKASTNTFGVVKLANALVNDSNDVVTSGLVTGAINDVNVELDIVKTSVGTNADAGDANGSLYARIKALRDTSIAHASKIESIDGKVKAAEAAITEHTSQIGDISGRVEATEAQLTWLLGATPAE